MENKKVLHLDDNPIFNDLIKLLFDDINIEYNSVLNVEYNSVLNTDDAWKELEKTLPDLLIVDLMLENDWEAKSGVEFTKKAYKNYPTLNIMILSSRSDKSLRDELEAYIVRYETKTFRPSTFKKNIVKFLSN